MLGKHRVYRQFPELCGQRQRQPAAEKYDALWLRFCIEVGISKLNKQPLPKALQEWKSWGAAQLHLWALAQCRSLQSSKDWECKFVYHSNW